jgi:hypothetical protein
LIQASPHGENDDGKGINLEPESRALGGMIARLKVTKPKGRMGGKGKAFAS